jgi:hypothetical protein
MMMMMMMTLLEWKAIMKSSCSHKSLVKQKPRAMQKNRPGKKASVTYKNVAAEKATSQASQLCRASRPHA